MSKKLLVILLTVFLLLPALIVWGADELAYNGASSIGVGILEAGAVKAFEAKTKIKFKSIEYAGTGKGIQLVAEGKVPLAGAGRTLKPEEKKQGLLGHTIGYDALAIFVHKNNPIKNLTKDQLKGIFTGKIKNWKEVGGKNALIRVYTEPLSSKRATLEMIQEMVMDNAPYGKPYKEMDIVRDILLELSKDENGVCAASYGLPGAIDAGSRANIKFVSVNGVEVTESNVKSGAYLLSRNLTLVTKGLPKGSVKEFINFMLSPEGQAIVAKNFVPVRR